MQNFARHVTAACAGMTVLVALWNGGKPWTRAEVFLGGMIVGFVSCACIVEVATWARNRPRPVRWQTWAGTDALADGRRLKILAGWIRAIVRPWFWPEWRRIRREARK